MRPRLLLLLPLLLIACKGADTIAPVSGGGGPVPLMGHVIVVVEENTDYSSVIGSSSMPYLNGLAQQYALAPKYYAVTHPSIGNYFMMTVGKIITNDDSYSGVVSDDNIIRRLLAAGKTWKSYAEDLPSVGYTGGDAGNYARKHNVIALLSDVVNSATQRDNLVPFSQFATDLAAGNLPDYSFVAPNLCNDAHDCSLATADQWLQTNIDPLVKNAAFQRDGLLVITFDESSGDNVNGGGHVANGNIRHSEFGARLYNRAFVRPISPQAPLSLHDGAIRSTLPRAHRRRRRRSAGDDGAAAVA